MVDYSIFILVHGCCGQSDVIAEERKQFETRKEAIDFAEAYAPMVVSGQKYGIKIFEKKSTSWVVIHER